MIIDRTFNKLFVMIPILVFLTISCSNMMNPHSGKSPIPVSTPLLKPVTQIIIKHDTVYRKLQTDDVEFRNRVEKMFTEQNARQSARFDTSDSHLKELIVLMSQQNLYVAARARMYRVANDSLASVLMKNQQQSKIEILNSIKKYSEDRKLNKSTLTMYDVLGTICFTIIILTYLLKTIEVVRNWIVKPKKQPAL